MNRTQPPVPATSPARLAELDADSIASAPAPVSGDDESASTDSFSDGYQDEYLIVNLTSTPRDWIPPPTVHDSFLTILASQWSAAPLIAKVHAFGLVLLTLLVAGVPLAALIVAGGRDPDSEKYASLTCRALYELNAVKFGVSLIWLWILPFNVRAAFWRGRKDEYHAAEWYRNLRVVRLTLDVIGLVLVILGAVFLFNQPECVPAPALRELTLAWMLGFLAINGATAFVYAIQSCWSRDGAPFVDV
ncbi:hypothetical protein H9P43_006283 [Blastocladiella emersonii ATCC 22665]|nr:hypothetical protein H9P43_006283 [Blastocladiella emersonii ATCC 22665]